MNKFSEFQKRQDTDLFSRFTESCALRYMLPMKLPMIAIIIPGSKKIGVKKMMMPSRVAIPITALTVQ